MNIYGKAIEFLDKCNDYLKRDEFYIILRKILDILGAEIFQQQDY